MIKISIFSVHTFYSTLLPLSLSFFFFFDLILENCLFELRLKLIRTRFSFFFSHFLYIDENLFWIEKEKKRRKMMKINTLNRFINLVFFFSLSLSSCRNYDGDIPLYTFGYWASAHTYPFFSIFLYFFFLKLNEIL